MLDNPFAAETVKEMVRWRVTQGHSTFDPDQASVGASALGESFAFESVWKFGGLGIYSRQPSTFLKDEMTLKSRDPIPLCYAFLYGI